MENLKLFISFVKITMGNERNDSNLEKGVNDSSPSYSSSYNSSSEEENNSNIHDSVKKGSGTNQPEKLYCVIENQLKISKIEIEKIHKKSHLELTSDDFDIQYNYINLLMMKYQSRGIEELCKKIDNSSSSQLTPLQLLSNIFFKQYFSKNLYKESCMDAIKFEIKTKTEICDDQDTLCVNFSSFIKNSSFNIESMWIIDMKLDHIVSSIYATLEFNTEIPGSRTVIVEPQLPSNITVNNSKESHILESLNPFVIWGNGQRNSINRDTLWAMIITVKKWDFIYQFCNKLDKYTFMKKNTFTVIFVHVLLKSGANIPPKILSYIWNAKNQSDKKCFRWETQHFEKVMVFVKPFLQPNLISDLDFTIRKFNREKWNKKNDGQFLKLGLTIEIFARINFESCSLSYDDKPDSNIPQALIGTNQKGRYDTFNTSLVMKKE